MYLILHDILFGKDLGSVKYIGQENNTYFYAEKSLQEYNMGQKILLHIEFSYSFEGEEDGGITSL